MIFRKQIFAYLLIFTFSAHAFAQASVNSLSAAEAKIAAGITIESSKESSARLSSAEKLGHGAMQPDGEKAPNSLAERINKLGLKSLGDDSLRHGTRFAFLFKINSSDRTESRTRSSLRATQLKI